MRVLFLDIDGVLNSADYMKHRRHIRRPTREAIDAPTVPRLNAITDRSGAAAVISSTWRKMYQLDDLARVLAQHGVTGRVIGATPVLLDPLGPPHKDGFQPCCSKPRAHEIAAWLDAHPEVTSFAVLDDDSGVHALPRISVRVVQTTWQLGLLDEHVERVCSMFADAP